MPRLEESDHQTLPIDQIPPILRPSRPIHLPPDPLQDNQIILPDLLRSTIEQTLTTDVSVCIAHRDGTREEPWASEEACMWGKTACEGHDFG